MIKTKLRFAQGSLAPYFAAVLAMITAAAYFVECSVTMTKYRLSVVLPMGQASLFENVAWLLQVGAMVLLAVLLIAVVKKHLAVLAIPVALYGLGTIFLVLENNNKYYSLLIGALVFFYFFTLMVLNIMHTKVPALVIEMLVLAGVAVLCVLKMEPFVTNDPYIGTMLELSVLLQTIGYYLTMLLITVALTKKYVTELPEETMVTEEKNSNANERQAEQDITMDVGEAQNAYVLEEEAADASGFSVKDWLDQQEAQTEGPQPTVPVTGSRLQKSLKEDIVYDRDQKLMYKKKINVFSVLGLILSLVAIVLGVIGISSLVEVSFLQNESLNFMLFALGLSMLCMFGTRISYKEYYTKTIVTERKVVREESNWEEFIANRLEEDERSIASLTESYSKMTEMYGRLLETTAELSGSIKALQMNGESARAIAEVEKTAEDESGVFEEAVTEDDSETVIAVEETPEEASMEEALKKEADATEPEAGKESYYGYSWNTADVEETPEETEEEEEAQDFVLPTFRGFGYEDMDLAEKPEEPDDELFGNKKYQMKSFSSRKNSAYYDMLQDEEEDDEDDMPRMVIPESVKAKLYDVVAEDEESAAREEVAEAYEEETAAEEPAAELTEEPEEEEPALPEVGDEGLGVQEMPVTMEEERRRKLREKLDAIYRRNEAQKRAREEFKDLEEDIIVIR